jgi:hypothetical protein
MKKVECAIKELSKYLLNEDKFDISEETVQLALDALKEYKPAPSDLDDKMIAFFRIEEAPYLSSGVVDKIDSDNNVYIKELDMTVHPVRVVPYRKGVILQEELNKAYNSCVRATKIAESCMTKVADSISDGSYRV